MSSFISSTIGLLGIYPYYKLTALFFSVMLFRQLKKGRDSNPNRLPLPPGPKGYPLIGNLFDMPVHKPWVVYDEWRKTYGKPLIINGLSPKITGLSGDMIYLNVLGQPFVILCSLDVITDLFEKRSSNYSDRKHMTMLIELYVSSYSFHFKEFVKNAVRYRMGFSISMVVMPYGAWWRAHRKLFHEYFHRNAVTKYQPIQRQEAQAFLRRLLVTPNDFFHDIRR